MDTDLQKNAIVSQFEDAIDNLIERGWKYEFDRSVAKLTQGEYVIKADGRWKLVSVPGTVLQQSVRNIEEIITAVQTFAYAIDNDLVSIANQWTHVVEQLYSTPWSIALLENDDSLQQLKSIIDKVK